MTLLSCKVAGDGACDGGGFDLHVSRPREVRIKARVPENEHISRRRKDPPENYPAAALIEASALTSLQSGRDQLNFVFPERPPGWRPGRIEQVDPYATGSGGFRSSSSGFDDNGECQITLFAKLFNKLIVDLFATLAR